MSNRIKTESTYRIDHIPGEDIDPHDELEGMQTYNEYDQAGNLILEIAYTHDGDIADKMEYRYDDKGKLQETLIYGEDDEVLERKELIWGNDDRVLREIIHYLDGSEDIHEFIYDENGRLTGARVKDDEGDIEYSEKYFYDGELVKKVERWNGEDRLIFSQEDDYENGKIKTRTVHSSEDEEPFTLVQHFNAKGQRIEEFRYDSRNKPVEHNVWEEDENGRIVRTVEENRLRKNTSEYTYDDHGRVIYQKETDLKGELNHEIYRYYDADGEPLKTTVEMIMKPLGDRRAYSLVYKREYYGG
jgi:antitoxin component YwqK of YwqJK toxin-antitoxin module